MIPHIRCTDSSVGATRCRQVHTPVHHPSTFTKARPAPSGNGVIRCRQVDVCDCMRMLRVRHQCTRWRDALAVPHLTGEAIESSRSRVACVGHPPVECDYRHGSRDGGLAMTPSIVQPARRRRVNRMQPARTCSGEGDILVGAISVVALVGAVRIAPPDRSTRGTAPCLASPPMGAAFSLSWMRSSIAWTTAAVCTWDMLHTRAPQPSVMRRTEAFQCSDRWALLLFPAQE